MWNMTYMQGFEEADIALALKSIRETGGSVMDAAVIKMAAGKKAEPYLTRIEHGQGNVEIADSLEQIIWQKH